jgi:hypothetical protein
MKVEYWAPEPDPDSDPKPIVSVAGESSEQAVASIATAMRIMAILLTFVSLIWGCCRAPMNHFIRAKPLESNISGSGSVRCGAIRGGHHQHTRATR